jgi:hypothetical protein
MDRRVERARERAQAESAPRALSAPDARRLDDMERRAGEALAAAEGAGEAGDVLAALDAAGAASDLRASAARSRQQLTQPERVLTVCGVCGIFISSTDNEARRQEHVTGKQYLGWKRLRETLKRLEEEEEEEGGGGGEGYEHEGRRRGGGGGDDEERERGGARGGGRRRGGGWDPADEDERGAGRRGGGGWERERLPSRSSPDRRWRGGGGGR